MILTLNGVSKSVPEWSREVGIPSATIVSRINRGWTHEKALTEEVFSNDNKITKNDAELWLNDCPLNDLPNNLRKIILENTGPSMKRYGSYLRRYSSKDFDQWFKNVYLKEKQNEKHNNSRRKRN